MILTFLSLSDSAKAYILVLCILTVILMLIALIAYMAQKRKSLYIAVLSLFFVIGTLVLSALLELNKVGKAKYSIEMTETYVLIDSIPCYIYIALNLIFAFFTVFSIYNLRKNGKNQINTFSVKEALENLPTGIAFMTNDDELLLSNHIMHNLCKKLTGKTLQSVKLFWQNITGLQNTDKCVIKGKEPAFVLSNGEIWQFSKAVCKYNGDEYYELKATDITELYNLSENTRSINEKLIEQQKRLNKLTDIIEENAESGVALNMKINFHDNFGNLLTLTKKALRESENTDESKMLVDYWANLNSVIKELSSDDKQSLSLEQIMLFAQKLGCEIILSGELPLDEQHKITTLLCINEMLKNAYRHAGAQKLTVNIYDMNEITNLVIQNETEHKLLEIKEGGGLSGLRKRIEQAGGTMVMSCNNGVIMEVKLLKGGTQYV